MREIIAGANFSGRSALLMARLRERAASRTFFVGPYAEAALSGLASTVADEIAIYRAPNARPAFAPLDFAALAARKPATLSGGEQVLLALHCFSQSRFGMIGIDTALEQLDARNRADALAYLTSGDFDALLIDNRIDSLNGWSQTPTTGTADAFACDLAAFGTHRPGPQAPAITIERLSFRYRGSRDIFRDVDLTLSPGRAYRLTGPNGAGKTTLFKLLAGVLVPGNGRIALDGKTYMPWREGNRIFAYATQNPDHQWCGATLGEDLARRRAALADSGTAPAEAELSALAARFGVSLDQHLYELPLAARKRLTWAWPLAGVLPWIMLDEPTVGQDAATRTALAAAVARLCALGYGIVFITHDDALANAVAHRVLLIDDGAIRVL